MTFSHECGNSPDFEEIMNHLRLTLSHLQDTAAVGRRLGQLCQPGDVICLEGDLGAGKTTLTQLIAAGLKVDEGQYVTSPSFAIMHEYNGRLPLYHMDFYRLGGVDDVEALGFDEYFYLEGLTVIEWANRAEEILPEKRLTIAITLQREQSRIAHFSGPDGFKHIFESLRMEFPALVLN